MFQGRTLEVIFETDESDSEDEDNAVKVWELVKAEVESSSKQSEAQAVEARLSGLRRVSPLRLSQGKYSFMHKSFYEFFIAKGLVLLACKKAKGMKRRKTGEMHVHEHKVLSEAIASLSDRSIQEDPEVCRFLAKAYQQESRALSQKREALSRGAEDQGSGLSDLLLGIVSASKGHPEHVQSASNAATLMARSGISMANQDWSGSHLSGADLGMTYLVGTKFINAHLRDIHWVGAFVWGCDFSGAVLEGANFGEYPRMDF